MARLESRQILDTSGADKLLGKGDLLYLPPGSAKLIRAQGAFITDRGIQSVVAFITKQARPSYELEIHQQLSRAGAGSDDESGIDEDEEIIQDCIEVIRSEQKASVSLLQRCSRLGYGRAARIMDELENRGIVGPSNGEGPRDILIDSDGHGADGIPPQGSKPDEQPPVTQPQLVVCLCQHCNGKIEFDANPPCAGLCALLSRQAQAVAGARDPAHAFGQHGARCLECVSVCGFKVLPALLGRTAAADSSPLHP